jgi:uncharacterized membrane protein
MVNAVKGIGTALAQTIQKSVETTSAGVGIAKGLVETGEETTKTTKAIARIATQLAEGVGNKSANFARTTMNAATKVTNVVGTGTAESTKEAFGITTGVLSVGSTITRGLNSGLGIIGKQLEKQGIRSNARKNALMLELKQKANAVELAKNNLVKAQANKIRKNLENQRKKNNNLRNKAEKERIRKHEQLEHQHLLNLEKDKTRSEQNKLLAKKNAQQKLKSFYLTEINEISNRSKLTINEIERLKYIVCNYTSSTLIKQCKLLYKFDLLSFRRRLDSFKELYSNYINRNISTLKTELETSIRKTTNDFYSTLSGVIENINSVTKNISQKISSIIDIFAGHNLSVSRNNLSNGNKTSLLQIFNNMKRNISVSKNISTPTQNSTFSIPPKINEKLSLNKQSTNTQPINTQPINTQPINTLSVNKSPINTRPINTQPINTLSVNKSTINTRPINTQPITTLSVNKSPINTRPINTQPINTLSVNKSPINTRPINTQPITTLSVNKSPITTLSVNKSPITTLSVNKSPIITR